MGVQNPNQRPVRVVKVKPPKVRIVAPRPEVSVQAKPQAKVGSKRFPAPKPEVTRPVTKAQGKAIARGVEQARRQTFAATVSQNVARSYRVDQLQAQAKETERRMNEGALPLVPKIKVRVRDGKLIASSPTFFGLSHSEQVVSPYGQDSVAFHGQPKDKLADVVPGAAKSIEKKLIAPGAKVLALTTTPLHAIAGAANRAEGRGVAGLTPAQIVKGAKEGIKNKTTYSTVLKKAGVKNKVALAVGGFAADVALDPTTYTTFGLAAPAEKLAQRAGEKAYSEAVAKGLSHAKATSVAEKAAAKVAKTAPQNKGLKVSLAGKGTSGRATAYVSRKVGLSKAATTLRNTKVVQGLGRDLRPGFRPQGVSPQEHTTIRAAAREARAQTTRGRVGAVAKAQALRGALPKDDYARVVNAIERGTVYDLPAHLRGPAREVELSFRRARKAEIKAGIQTPNRRGYFTHAIEQLPENVKAAARGGGRRVIKPTYAKGRQYGGTVEQIAATGGPKFSTDVPKVAADRLARSARDVAQAKFNRTLLQAGRKVPHGESLTLTKDEALYRIKGANVEKVAPKDEARAVSGDTSNLRILNQHAVDAAYASIVPGASRSSIGTAYDKLQGGFKFIATAPNPGFHARNFYGDTQNAYLAQSGLKLPANMVRSSKALHALGKQEKAARTLGETVRPTEKGITVKGKFGGKEFLTYDQLANEAVTHGAIRSGFLSKEIPELVRSGNKVGKDRLPRLKRLAQNREDLPRLATYIGARKRGLTPREAADWAAGHHFDYADLTGFERTVARRLLPFYTFSARNIPLQAKRLLTNPGKFANVEKAREEMAQATGLPKDWESRVAEYQQRGIPFPVAIGGKPFIVSPSLPLNDLNQLTLPGVSVKDFTGVLSEQGKKFLSMVNPVLKSPIEIYANYNSFFRGPIQRPDSPLVAAPSYVSMFPASWRKKLGIVPDYIDKRSGKKGWGWPAKVDYVAKVVPGPPNVAQQLLSPLSNRRGQGEVGKAVSYLTGLKADPYDPTTAAINNAYAEIDKLNQRQAALRQRGQGSAQSGRKETPAYIANRDRLKELTAAIAALRTKRGDVSVKKVSATKQAHDLLYGSGGSSTDVKKAHEILYGNAGSQADVKRAHQLLYGG